MRWLLVLLLMLVGSAEAAPPCYPFGIKGESQFKGDWFRRTDNGWYAFWLCKNAMAKWDGYGLYCRHGACAQNLWLEAEIAIGTALDKATATDQAYAKYVTGADCATEIATNTANAPICNDLQIALRSAVLAANPLPPPPPSYTVVPNTRALDLSRPVYPFTNGLRGTTAVSGVRAAAGSACDCAAKSVEGSSLYCGVNQRLDIVALCESK